MYNLILVLNVSKAEDHADVVEYFATDRGV